MFTPLAVSAADDHDKDHDRKEHRYYDRSGKHWHDWDDQEDRAYRNYVQERKQEYRTFDRASKKDQGNYWKWRHNHPDRD